MKKIYALFLAVIFVFVQFVSKAQNPFGFHLSDKKELPSSKVYHLGKDSKGFIWMSSNAGLFRYDGYQYKIYKSEAQTSLAGSAIKEDRYGRVWYENFDGFLYYVENDTLNSLKQNSPMGFVPQGITDKHLFVVQKNGVDVFDLTSLALIKTIPILLEEPEHATVLGSSFYLTADHVIYKIDENLSLSSNTFFKDKKFKVKYINAIDDRIYVVSKNNEDKKIYYFDEKLQFTNAAPIKEVKYIQGSTVVDGKIWIFSSEGAFVYNLDGSLHEKSPLFQNESVSSVIKDYQNNYWISTTYNGVYVVPAIRDKLYPLRGYEPLRIAKKESGYLMGTFKGEVLQLNEKFEIEKSIAQNNESLPVSYLLYDSLQKQTIFSGKGFSIVDRFGKENNINVAVKQIVDLDKKYTAYAASGSCGLLLKSNARSSFSSIWDDHFQNNRSDKKSNMSRILNGLRGKAVDYHVQQQKILYATNIGLFLVTPQEWKEVLKDSASFYANDVIWMDNLIFTLDTKGTFYQISENGKFVNLNKKLGFDEIEIRRIKKVGNEIIMIGAHQVYIYDFKVDKIVHSPVDIGFNVIMDVIKSDDTLMILTNDGILKTALSRTITKVPPQFYVNSIRVNNRTRKLESGKLALSFMENNITLDFSLLEFDGNITPFYYRINRKEWIAIHNATRKLEFPSLSDGAYLIEFKVGDQKIRDASIQLIISAPFWKAWWFYLLTSVIVATLLWVYFRRESNRMHQQIKLLNEKMILEKSLSKSVMTSIKSQMNPHFFYNALNTIQAYIFTNDRQNANTYLAKFSKLTRIILEMSEKETVSLAEEIEALKLYLELEKMRFKNSFEYTINAFQVKNIDSIELPPMLIQPYVENAIKHGLLHRVDDKILDIIFEIQGHFLKVIVEDNGIGRKRSEALNKIKEGKHQSFSTKANEKRLEILNKGVDQAVEVKMIDKYDESGAACGTRVELLIRMD